MSDGWDAWAVSDIAHIQQGRTLAGVSMRGGEHPVFGANGVIGWHDAGLYAHEVVALGCRGSCGSIHIAPPGAWLANNVMALWPRHPDALTTRYLALALECADLVSSGVISGQVQPQITRTSLSPLRVPVPPLPEQRRIVDLMGAVDDTVTAASDVARCLRESHWAIREELLSKSGRHVRLGDVITRIDAGRSPDAEDRQPADGETTVLKVSAVRPGWFDRTQVKVVKDASVFPAHALVRDGDLLMTRANGNRDLLGVVCITEHTPERCFLSDKTLRIVPHEPAVIPIFLMEALMSSDSRHQIAQSGTGTASMKNISQASIENLTVPLPSSAQQAIFAALADALRVATRNAEREAATLSGLRGALLTSLLSGEHEIPSSYDRLLDSVA